MGTENETTVYQGELIATGLRFGIACSRFNELFVSKLLDGALDCIERHGGQKELVEVAWTPGSFELPMVCERFASSEKFDAVIALGVVIQGGTPHAQYINSEVAKGIAHSAHTTGLPVIYGVVTADSIEQAIERSGTKAGNRGADAALSAIEMANLYQKLPSGNE